VTFNWQEFLALARDLCGRSGSLYSAEAANRTVVSRAYYAAFCHARDFAEKTLDFRRTKTAQDHRLLRAHLEGKGSPWDEVAEHLDDLRMWRNQCDYDETVQNLGAMVPDAIACADGIIRECK